MSKAKKTTKPAGKLLEQLINITDLTLRHAKDTAAQSEALELKKLLEAHQKKAA
jgi:hypothetical protein